MQQLAAAAPAPPLTKRSQHLPTLTGLRFVAAFMVALCHVGIHLLPRVAPGAKPLIGLFHGIGAAALSFFFILSGFVLTWAAKESDTARLFWRRRFFRVFPNHIVGFVVIVVLAAAAGHALSTRDTITSLFLVHAWIPDQELLYNLWSNTPTWSLAAELCFYLSFPLLLTLVRKIRPQRLWLAFGLTFAAILAVPVIAGTLLATGPTQAGTGLPWLSFWFMNFFPPARMLEFVLGILVAHIVMHGRWIRLPLPVTLLLPLVAILAQGFVPLRFGLVWLTAIPLALLVGTAAVSDITNRSGFFGGRVMVFLGQISYAFFVIHWLVVAYGWVGRTSPAFGGDPSGTSTWPAVLGMTALTIASCLVLGWLLHVLVERPVMRRWSNPRKKVPVTT
jgi:peptidoglycan/LPS O-acetylase OafA/YrhL